jgi:hypothetical protein
MSFSAWKHKERNRHKNGFIMTSRGFRIAVINNSLIDTK